MGIKKIEFFVDMAPSNFISTRSSPSNNTLRHLVEGRTEYMTLKMASFQRSLEPNLLEIWKN